uniref:TM2 domain containing 1 n=1 Tax=Sphenodon punctatus TaxID=8508 RepID=A0A8D0LAI0_SPHPU
MLFLESGGTLFPAAPPIRRSADRLVSIMAAWQRQLQGTRRKKGAAAVGAARFLAALWLVCLTAEGVAGGELLLKCEELRLGQYPESITKLFSLIIQTYICEDPKIDNITQEPLKCTNHTAYVPCLPAPNITCKDFSGNETHFTGKEVGFYKPIVCRNVNGYSYKVAVALSLFLGWLGADRFYLGYPALGECLYLLNYKVFYIITLFACIIVGPSDGSSYIIDYYGARLTRLTITNETFRKTQTYP